MVGRRDRTSDLRASERQPFSVRGVGNCAGGDHLDQSTVEVSGVDHVVDEALRERAVLLAGRAGPGAGHGAGMVRVMVVPLDGGFQWSEWFTGAAGVA